MTEALARGHDFSRLVRYRTYHPVVLTICHDCGRPIPPNVRAYRRMDNAQDYPTICLPCHETIESAMYRQVFQPCAGCGEELRWIAGAWTHSRDFVLIRYRKETCPHCQGEKCRMCLHTGVVQVEDHRALPDVSAPMTAEAAASWQEKQELEKAGLAEAYDQGGR